MPTLRFEGRPIPFAEGDTLATALYRSGLRVFTRSFEYHRPRGLYCLSGDCPNCLVNVDGVPGVRACVTPARRCEVQREGGFPSVGFDLLSLLHWMRWALPVGFYYKTFIRPRWAWPLAERLIQRATGIGALPRARAPQPHPAEHVHPDVLVVGGGAAGLAAAEHAARDGASVLLCEEHRVGDGVFDDQLRTRLRRLRAQAESAGALVLERATAIGIYAGPLVPITTEQRLLVAYPRRVIVATGAVDRHEVFAGNDVPGVWQGRAAGVLSARHGLVPGQRAVVLAGARQTPALVQTLQRRGVEIVAVIWSDEVAASGFPAATLLHGHVRRVVGRRRVRGIEVDTPSGCVRLRCDAVIVSRSLAARDTLLRMAPDEAVVGAGEVLRPGCDIDEAIASGHRAARGRSAGPGSPVDDQLPPVPEAGVVCLCEDVTVGDLVRAQDEGFDTSELLKRYSTASMGPCQGIQCGRYVACMSSPAGDGLRTRTTARPPARPVALEQIAGFTHEGIRRHTALHDVHTASGARLGPSGPWIRPFRYGSVEAEYRAVRERVSIMDVSTLGKVLVAGPAAREFVDYVVPCRTTHLSPGKARYVVLLDDAGYVFDDGVLVALGPERFSLTTTSSGASRVTAWLQLLAGRRGADVHIVDLSEARGAIAVVGPQARALLQGISDDDLSREAFPFMTHREIVVAGIGCSAIRVGFVGELSFELHHPRDRSVALWTALTEAGKAFDMVPHGLDALDVLRLEKGHLYIGQDSLPDDTPRKLGLGRMVAMDKGEFVGRPGIVRLDRFPLERSLSGLVFDGDSDPDDLAGQPITRRGAIVGRVTSCEYSPALGRPIGLGWLTRAAGNGGGDALRANGTMVRPTATPFIDPDGTRVRG